MPPKKKSVMAPIDRPLSRAYARQFTGWSTAYPPGVSDPTSFRIMENVQINRDGSARVRPGLRYISFDVDGADNLIGISEKMVGTHEPFFLNDGSKAYLFAAREVDGSVGFRVLAQGPLGLVVQSLSSVGFEVPQGEAVLAFSEDTTYVKYVQIDNKIFALSNAGETMRLFYVGEQKKAKKLSSIERPDWIVTDKLVVVHPEAAWTNSGIPLSERTNHVKQPNMNAISLWEPAPGTDVSRSNVSAQAGAYSLRLESLPSHENLMPQPLDNITVAADYDDWQKFLQTDQLEISSGNVLRVTWTSGKNGQKAQARSPKMPCTAGKNYRATFDFQGGGANLSGLRLKYFFYTTAGAQIGSPIDKEIASLASPERKTPGATTAPDGATEFRVAIEGDISTAAAANFSFGRVLAYESSTYTGTDYFDGDNGADYFWTGTPKQSSSIYHPPQEVEVSHEITSINSVQYTASGYLRPGSTVRTPFFGLYFYEEGNPSAIAWEDVALAEDAGAWKRYNVSETAPATAATAEIRVTIPAVARGEYHYLDSVMMEQGAVLNDYYDGDSTDTTTLQYEWVGDPDNSKSKRYEYASAETLPPSETKTVDTLVSSTKANNEYTMAFFYTFSNEVGESAASMVTTKRVQRPWVGWLWETPNAAGEPSGTETNDPGLVADQLAVYMPVSAFEAAQDQGATAWHLYATTWSDQDVAPVVARKIATRTITPTSSHAGYGWIKVTPAMANAGTDVLPIPTATGRYNFSAPSAAGQGVVAADRMILVNDPTAAAVIRWTSNQMGSYTDFSSAKGGGYKTLTSGNLFVPAAVKLWQNPQSADTITILCQGVDGYSTGYYMQPAQVAQQADAVNVMGFEETTATPGTVSPYGVEVLNNALYHPLDEQLMKSTATNYNINHKSMTDLIACEWHALQNKHRIVSSQHDNRLYLLVDNPDGEVLQDGCFGNEVWVLDTASKTGSWSRWLVQGSSLRKIEQGGLVTMSLVRPEGLFYFDESYDRDDVVDPVTKAISQQFIPFHLETNTQGANRAHDAWAHLQQANVVLGNWQGKIRYGVRGVDLHGKPVNISKVFEEKDDPGLAPFDREDYLLIRKDMKEWYFYAESVPDEKAFGQLNLVQYRYAPISVNVGYEYGSIETFEYGRDVAGAVSSTTESGVPLPVLDSRRP